MELIYETKSKLNLIKVFRDLNGVYYLRMGRGTEIHSMYDPKNVLFTDVEEHYWNYFNLFPFIQDLKDVLLLGLGCGTVAKQLLHFFPDLKIDAVEIDDQIIAVARRFFDLSFVNINIFNEDGLEFLKEENNKYGLIIVDAFEGGNISKAFLPNDVFLNAKKRLKQKGILAINFIDESPFTSIIKNRMLGNFENVHILKIKGTYNNIIFGSDHEHDMEISVFDTSDKELRRLIKYFKENVKKIK